MNFYKRSGNKSGQVVLFDVVWFSCIQSFVTLTICRCHYKGSTFSSEKEHLHFIQVTNPFIIYSHFSFRHVEPCSMAGQNQVLICLARDLAHHESPIPQWSVQPLSGKSWVRLPLGTQKIIFLSISTWEGFSIILTLSKSPVHLSFTRAIRNYYFKSSWFSS